MSGPGDEYGYCLGLPNPRATLIDVRVQGFRLVVGGWRLVVVGGVGCRLLVGGWQLLPVGGWWLADGCWRLVVGS